MKGRLLDAVPLSSLTGVGAALSNKLAKINLHIVQDLLYTFLCATKIAHISTPSVNYCRVFMPRWKAKC